MVALAVSTRRRFLAGSTLAVVAAGLPRTARADGQRVLVLGDSMIAGGFGLFLARDLEKDLGYDTARRGKSSSGLARPDFFDWMKEAKKLVAENPFDAYVVMFGGNDVQGLYMGDGNWIRWPDEGWTEEYARRINELCDLLAPEGQRIFWCGLPIMKPGKFGGRVQKVNTIYNATISLRPGALFVDTWAVLADEAGEYADKIELVPGSGKKVRVRAGDGIHLSPAGAQHLADHVEAIVHGELSVA
jgi:hypothetical protein